jgi:hypothetical protein
METARHATDEQAVRRLDESWNDVYLRNDRSAFAEILSDDFCATFHDGRTGSKGDMMQPTPAGARVRFREGLKNWS